MHYDLATVDEVIADAVPERDAIVFRDRRITYGELTKRTRQLANYLAAQGFGHHTERADLDDWQSGQDHLGIYLYKGTVRPHLRVGGCRLLRTSLPPCRGCLRIVARTTWPVG